MAGSCRLCNGEARQSIDRPTIQVSAFSPPTSLPLDLLLQPGSIPAGDTTVDSLPRLELAASEKRKKRTISRRRWGLFPVRLAANWGAPAVH